MPRATSSLANRKAQHYCRQNPDKEATGAESILCGKVSKERGSRISYQSMMVCRHVRTRIFGGISLDIQGTGGPRFVVGGRINGDASRWEWQMMRVLHHPRDIVAAKDA